jgi:hypothetical protein
MPCRIQIEEKIRTQAEDAIRPYRGRDYIKLRVEASNVNKRYGYPVVQVSQWEADIYDVNVNVPEPLIEEYYQNELRKEEEEARQSQIEDAERAGEIYNDRYLFDNKQLVLKTMAEQGVDDYDEVMRSLKEDRIMQVAKLLGERFQKAFGIPHEVITAAQARELLRGTNIPYTGEAAFYYGNVIYVVEGNMKPSAILHEYAHPFIQALEKDNPQLFERLFYNLATYDVGQQIIQEIESKYPELEGDTQRFKQEVLVTALERAALDNLAEIEKNDPDFDNFISQLLYAIKKIIRKLVDKVNLKELSPNTTMEELADMFLDPQFVIEVPKFSEDSFVYFKKNLSDFTTQLQDIKYDSLIDTINRVHQEAKYEIAAIKAAPFRLTKELSGKDGIKLLRGVEGSLKNFQTYEKDPSKADPQVVADAMLDHTEEFNKRALALINSMNEMEVFAENIEKVLDEMKENKEHFTSVGISKIMYFKDFIARQSEFIDEIKEISGLKKTNEFYKKLNSIDNTLQGASKQIKRLQREFVTDFFGKSTNLMTTNLEEGIKERITKVFKADGLSDEMINEFYKTVINTPNGKTITIKDANYPLNPKRAQRLINEVNEYFAKRLGKEQIDDFIEGRRDDLGFFSAWITPYANIDDPLVGSFANFIKRELKKAENKSLRQANDIAQRTFQLLKDVGYNPNSTGQLAKMVLFTDKVGTLNDKGEYEEFEVRSFMDKFKNWRYERGKLQHEFDEARESKDKDAIKKAYDALLEFDEKYMHRRYKKEYYDLQKIWKEGARVIDPFTKEEIVVSKEDAFQAWLERQTALDKLSVVKNVHFTELEDVEGFSMADAANAEYQRLFDVYNPDNTPKTGEELRKTLLRRFYRSESRKFYEYPISMDRVQQDLDNFIIKLAGEGITLENNEEKFNEKLEKFISVNFRTAYTDEYYSEKRRILSDIRAINNRAKANQDILDKREDLSKQLFELVNLVLDKNGQPNGIEFTPEQIKRVKTLEEEIATIDALYDKKSGLAFDDLDRYRKYEYKLANNKSLTESEEIDYQNLLKAKNEFGLSAVEKASLDALWIEYRGLAQKQPTEYYLEAFEYALGGLNVDPITMDNADEWINGPEVIKALAENPKFKNWFLRNHIVKEVFDASVSEMVPKYFRTSVWSVSRPSSESSYKKTTLVHPVTGEPLVIPGVPAGKYSYQKIKDQYLTIPKGSDKKQYVGKIIDNMGNFLPREYNPNDPDSAYDKAFINEEYEALDKNSSQFKLLEELKKIFLEIQEETTNSTKLYLDLPRMRMVSNLEYVQSGQGREDFKTKLEGVTSVIKAMAGKDRAADAAEDGFNADVERQYLITTDMQGKPLSRIPVRGLYKLKTSEASQDVLKVLYDYLYSINESSALRESEPLVNAVSDVLNDPANAIKKMDGISKQIRKATGKLQFIPKGKGNLRAQSIDYLIDKVYYGQGNDTLTEENPLLAKFSNFLMRAASRSFIALDVPSALKNRFGMIFQSLIETAGGKFVTPMTLAKGRAKSFTTIVELSSKGIYDRGPKSLDLQIMEYFDPITGKTKKDFGKSSSRTFMKDMMDFSFLYDFRRLAEVEASLQVFWGMMYHKKVTQVQADGTEKQLDYADAFELDPETKQIKLKEGIDPEFAPYEVNHTFTEGDTMSSIAKKYGITEDDLAARIRRDDLSDVEPGTTLEIGKSTKFLDFQQQVTNIGKMLNGQVNSLDSSQADKFLLYRLFTFYKKFATGMFLNRFQADLAKDNRWGHVYNWDLGTTSKGYYISAYQGIYKTLRDWGAYYPMMTDEEKIAIRKVVTEIAGVIVLGLAIGMLFGYDKGDEERFEKMRLRNEKYGELGGKITNHILYQLMMVKQENEAFVPILGTSEMVKYGDKTSIVFGPTINLYVKILADLWNTATGNPKALYRNDAGPYPWQEEGRYKLWNHLFSLYGIKGKTYDPIHAIKSAETFQNLK